MQADLEAALEREKKGRAESVRQRQETIAQLKAQLEEAGQEGQQKHSEIEGAREASQRHEERAEALVTETVELRVQVILIFAV